MQRSAVGAVAVFALLAACSAGSASGVGQSGPYRLYTHCGIVEAQIGKDYFVAVHPLDDGNGNPPSGWGNPYQDGTMERVSTNTAVFRDSLGHRVEFTLRPGATTLQTVCS